MPESSPPGPAAWYAERAARQGSAADALQARRERLLPPRVAAALAATALGLLAERLPGVAAWAAGAGALACAAAFALIVRTQRRLAREARWEATLAVLAREGQARLARDWAALALAPEVADEPIPPPDHPYARDLGILGRASLFRLCGPLTTPMARQRLATWLLATAPSDAVTARRDAVRALAQEPDWRMELTALGRGRKPGSAAATDRVLVWARSPGWLASPVAVAAWALPPLTLGLGVLSFVGVVGALWIPPLLLQLLVIRRVGRRIASETAGVSASAPSLFTFAAQLELLATVPGAAAALDEVRARIRAEEGAAAALRRLARWLDVADSRANLLYAPLNAVLLVDVHLQRALEGWKARHGAHASDWLDALGEVEALAGLATLTHDHPDWAFPAQEPAAASEPAVPLRARRLGHPLLPPGSCVRNDVEIPGPGAFLLVTGSNMSGKSTLLRAIGANVVLAQAGAPVCAEALRVGELRLHTSMAVEDSLEAGISRFMAELLRMKDIVEAARVGHVQRPVLYLLDEILQGTNSWERRAGARAVLRHLIDAGAVGALTTHDLTLHQAPDLEPRARAFHFRESVGQGKGGATLTFDHRLRPGLSTTRNAMALLEAVGLGPLPGQVREGAL